MVFFKLCCFIMNGIQSSGFTVYASGNEWNGRYCSFCYLNVNIIIIRKGRIVFSCSLKEME